MTETDTPIETIIDRIEQWLIELESGRHKQGKSFLRDADDCFCCLGVAAEFALDLNSVKREDGYEYIFSKLTDFGNPRRSDGILCDYTELGLRHFAGAAHYGGSDDALTALNDRLGKSFTEIAAILRDDLANSYYGYFIDAVYPAWRAKNGVKA